MSAATWPDLTVDRQAWDEARTALGPGAPTSAIAQRAQSIKVRITAQAEDDMERARR